MRVLAGCLLVAAAGVVLAPSSKELHRRYGAPDSKTRDEKNAPASENFTPRPGINLHVSYGSDHRACVISITPPQSPNHQERLPGMSSEGVSRILEEVAPVSLRGEKISSLGSQSNCVDKYVTEYESVRIIREFNGCDRSSPNHDIGTTIIYKRDICPKPKTPWTFTRP